MLPYVPGGQNRPGWEPLPWPPAPQTDLGPYLTSCRLLVAVARCCCPLFLLPRFLLDPQGHGARVERWGGGTAVSSVPEEQRPKGHAGNGRPESGCDRCSQPHAQQGLGRRPYLGNVECKAAGALGGTDSPPPAVSGPPGCSVFCGNWALLEKSVQAGAQNS